MIVLILIIVAVVVLALIALSLAVHVVTQHETGPCSAADASLT